MTRLKCVGIVPFTNSTALASSREKASAREWIAMIKCEMQLSDGRRKQTGIYI